MTGSIDTNVRGNKSIVTDTDLSSIQNNQVYIGIEVLSYFNIISVITSKGGSMIRLFPVLPKRISAIASFLPAEKGADGYNRKAVLSLSHDPTTIQHLSWHHTTNPDGIFSSVILFILFVITESFFCRSLIQYMYRMTSHQRSCLRAKPALSERDRFKSFF